MSNPIASFDKQAVKDELRELVRKTIEETINAMLDKGGQPAHRRGVPRRPLRANRRAQLHRHVGPGHAKNANLRARQVR